MGFKRGLQRASKPPPTTAPPVIPAPGPPPQGAFMVAVKALTYGTLLCIAGSGLAGVGIGMALGVSNVRVIAAPHALNAIVVIM